ncbi:hypothetical protein LEMLEM_LOCUS24152 [Lemmus lemmus]
MSKVCWKDGTALKSPQHPSYSNSSHLYCFAYCIGRGMWMPLSKFLLHSVSAVVSSEPASVVARTIVIFSAYRCSNDDLRQASVNLNSFHIV